MKKLFVLLNLMFVATYSNAATNEDFLAYPKQSELLPNAITFTNCPDVSIVEWKSNSVGSELNDDSKKAFEAACQIAFDKFPVFLKEKYNITFNKKSFSIKASVLPANPYYDGKKIRNLNDSNYRFSSIRKKDECCYWGFFMHSSNHLFIRNDIYVIKDNKKLLNKKFMETVIHELIHVQTDKFKININYFDGSDEKDEKLAQEFTTWLGF